jgi:hypothetical protein
MTPDVFVLIWTVYVVGPAPMPPAVTTHSQEFSGSVACDRAKRSLTDQEHLQLEGVELHVHVVAACHPKREGG